MGSTSDHKPIGDGQHEEKDYLVTAPEWRRRRTADGIPLPSTCRTGTMPEDG